MTLDTGWKNKERSRTLSDPIEEAGIDAFQKPKGGPNNNRRCRLCQVQLRRTDGWYCMLHSNGPTHQPPTAHSLGPDSWSTTPPACGYHGWRTYGGTSLPPGGRRMTKPWQTQVLSLLTKQQANARQHQARVSVNARQHQCQAKQNRKPRVPG